MAQITAQIVKDLREMTGAGMMDCKSALGETSGNVEAAVDWLRKKGLSKAAKKADRVAAEGLIGVAVKGTKGVLVEVNSETDFVARNEIGLGVDLDQHALGAFDRDPDQTFRGDAVGLLGGLGQAFFAQPIDRGFDVTRSLAERRLAIHHARASHLAQVLDN